MIFGYPVDDTFNLLSDIGDAFDANLCDLTILTHHNFFHLDEWSISEADSLTWHDAKEALLDLGREVSSVDID